MPATLAASWTARCNCLDEIGAVKLRPGEQSAMGEHHPAPPAFAPPQPEQFQKLQREHSVAVPASLALFDADQHACRVDFVDLEVRNLNTRRPAP